MKTIMTLMVAVLFLTAGCNSTRYIGKVGDVKFYKVHMNNFSGPSMTALVTLHTNGETRIESIMQPLGGGYSMSSEFGSGFGSSMGGMPMRNSTAPASNPDPPRGGCSSGNCYLTVP